MVKNKILLLLGEIFFFFFSGSSEDKYSSSGHAFNFQVKANESGAVYWDYHVAGSFSDTVYQAKWSFPCHRTDRN